MDEMVKAVPPRNLQRQEVRERRTATKGATALRVRTRGVERFHRAGLEFTSDPRLVDVSSLSEKQMTAILNASTLIVEELDGKGAIIGKPTPRPSAKPAASRPASQEGAQRIRQEAEGTDRRERRE